MNKFFIGKSQMQIHSINKKATGYSVAFQKAVGEGIEPSRGS